MSSDIPPLVAVPPPPLVREKRHYPGEQKNQSQNQTQTQKESDASTKDDEQHKEESDDDLSQKPVNTDKKNVKVAHIDEYV